MRLAASLREMGPAVVEAYRAADALKPEVHGRGEAVSNLKEAIYNMNAGNLPGVIRALTRARTSLVRGPGTVITVGRIINARRLVLQSMRFAYGREL